MIAFLTGPIGKLLTAFVILASLYGGFKLWLHEHDKAILAGFVALSEKTAAEAKAAKEEHDKQAAQQALEEQRKRTAAAEKLKDDANAELEKRIADDAKNTADGGCGWNADDDAHVMQHH
jgi:uncharacterized protein (DUF4415 family)